MSDTPEQTLKSLIAQARAAYPNKAELMRLFTEVERLYPIEVKWLYPDTYNVGDFAAFRAYIEDRVVTGLKEINTDLLDALHRLYTMCAEKFEMDEDLDTRRDIDLALTVRNRASKEYWLCACGFYLSDKRHFACPDCWSLLSKRQQDEVWQLRREGPGSRGHIEAVRQCRKAIRLARAGKEPKP